MTAQPNVSQTEKPSKNFSHYEQVYEPTFNIKTLHFPNSCYACFMPVAQQTHIPANRIHFYVLVIKAMCVYCEVGKLHLYACVI